VCVGVLGMGKQYKKTGSKHPEKTPLTVMTTVLIFGLLGSFFARTLVETFLCVELVTLSLMIMFFYVILPWVFPEKIVAEEVFTGGYAKPPYLSDNELLTPKIPFLKESEGEE